MGHAFGGRCGFISSSLSFARSFQSVFDNQRAAWRGAVCKDSTPGKLVSELVEVLQVRGVRSQLEDKELASSNFEKKQRTRVHRLGGIIIKLDASNTL